MLMLMFPLLFLLLYIEVPIAISIGLTAIYGIIVSDNLSTAIMANTMINSLNNFPLLAIPFFILAGNIMGSTGMAKKLLQVSQVFLGNKPGSLPVTTIVASAFFSALSGSGPATVAAIGGITIGPMVEQGYRKPFAGTLAATAGILGPVIPPSIVMIVYGISAGASIADLFLAGIIPGILMATAMIVVVKINMRQWGHELKLDTSIKYTLKDKFKSVWDAKWALIMPFIVLGTIYAGIATPTEAAVIATIYSFFVGILIEKDLKMTQLQEIFRQSITTCGSVLIIVGAATTFGYVLNMNQIPTQIATFITGLTSNPILILILINVFLIIVGCFMETVAAIIILTPLLLPIALAAGMSPISFGAMLCVNLVIGQITPPVGVCLFVASQIAKTSIVDLTKYLWQFLIALIIVLALVTFIPQLTELLPALLSSK